MKKPLYLVAMRGAGSGNIITWLSTSDFDTHNDVVLLDTLEIECEVKQSDAEIEAMLDAGKVREIDTLEAKLKELKGLKNETA